MKLSKQKYLLFITGNTEHADNSINYNLHIKQINQILKNIMSKKPDLSGRFTDKKAE